MTVQFVCGHAREVDGSVRPICVCGEARIVAVKAPAPHFRGYALGPHADFEALPAKAVDLTQEKK